MYLNLNAWPKPDAALYLLGIIERRPDSALPTCSGDDLVRLEALVLAEPVAQSGWHDVNQASVVKVHV